jgi:hypothetical protein
MDDSERQIPAEQRTGFLRELSDGYRGLRARVETTGPDGAARVVVDDAPFAGIEQGDDGLTIAFVGGMGFSVGADPAISTAAIAGDAGQVISFVGAGGQRTLLTIEGGPTLQEAIAAAEDDELTAVGGSAGAAGGSSAVPGARGADDADAGGLVSFGGSDDMGGVAAVGGPSVGDQDLSGAGAYDITDDVYGGPAAELQGGAAAHAGSGSETIDAGQSAITANEGAAVPGQSHLQPDVVDGGSGQGLLDRGIDPIEGSKLVPGTDPDDEMVEGEVGAQAEEDLSDLFGGTRTHERERRDDA